MQELISERDGAFGSPFNFFTIESRRKLIIIALRAVSNACPEMGEVNGRSEFVRKPLSRMLLSLLTYCYAVGIFGSQEIESRLARDARIRFLCARTDLSWHTLRRFRRQNRSAVKAALAQVFEFVPELILSSEMVSWPGARGSGIVSGQEANLAEFRLLCAEVAETRIQRALLADTAALDD